MHPYMQHIRGHRSEVNIIVVDVQGMLTLSISITDKNRNWLSSL